LKIGQHLAKSAAKYCGIFSGHGVVYFFDARSLLAGLLYHTSIIGRYRAFSRSTKHYD